MHFNSGILYIYAGNMCDEGARKKIAAHLEMCGDCRTKLEKVHDIRRMFISTMQPPPAFNASLYPENPPSYAGLAVFRFGWAAALIFTVLFGAALTVKHFIRPADTKTISTVYVYNNFKVIYDANFFTKNYLDRTLIVADRIGD